MKDFAYDTQLAAIPDTVSDAFSAQDLPDLDTKRPVIVTGISTSLHAAKVAAEWVTQLTGQTPRLCSKSSTFRSDSGNRTYNITASRMIAGDVLKYLKGLGLVMRGR